MAARLEGVRNGAPRCSVTPKPASSARTNQRKRHALGATNAGEGREGMSDQLGIEVFDNEDKPRAAIIVRPRRKMRRRVHQMPIA